MNNAAMLRALELATYAIKNCRPNPAVGAVAIKGGQTIGEGYTQAPGKEHAEIAALKNAGENAKGAELYVTLEPCCHYGRTPPCADAIIKAGIRKVCYGYLDPNPKVSGKGIEKLREAGIEIAKDNLGGQIDEFYESYSWFAQNKKTFATLKIAQSADGFIANEDKSPAKITGEESQRRLHSLRSFCDAIVIGGGTLRADNPQLTVRMAKGANPARIVFSRSNFSGGSFEENWRSMIADCSQKGMHHILIEAGASLADNLFSMENAFQRFLLWTSPRKLGRGLPWEAGAARDWRKRFALVKSCKQGDDFCEEFAAV